jgi:predicted PurR-regulated permease PerM
MRLSFKKAFFALATVMALFAILLLGQAVLVPLAFALLIAFILLPVVQRFEGWGAGKSLAAFLALLALFLVLGGGIVLFSSQISQVSNDLVDFKEKLLALVADVTLFFNKYIGFLPVQQRGDVLDSLKTWLNESAGVLLSETVSGTASISFGIMMAVVYIFLFLLYRKGLVGALVQFYQPQHQAMALGMFRSVQMVGQLYLFGMTVIILILGFVNSIGLWIIGIDYPFLFGFLAALLALIPYAGTFLGAALPILYAFVSYDALWMPISIGLFFWAVQFVEANFLTPKIVGEKLQINALTSILSIIIGAAVWGVAGMILFLPFAAMLKVICEAHEPLQPVALFIGDHRAATVTNPPTRIHRWLQRAKTTFTSLKKSI